QLINNLIEVHLWRKNVYEQIPGTNRKDARSFIGTPEKGRFDCVNRINVASHPGYTVFVSLNDTNKMPVRLALHFSAVDHMQFFAWFEEHNTFASKIPERMR